MTITDLMTIKEKSQLIKDIDFLIKEDKGFREEVIDEYVSGLSPKRFIELVTWVELEMEGDA